MAKPVEVVCGVTYFNTVVTRIDREDDQETPPVVGRLINSTRSLPTTTTTTSAPWQDDLQSILWRSADTCKLVSLKASQSIDSSSCFSTPFFSFHHEGIFFSERMHHSFEETGLNLTVNMEVMKSCGGESRRSWTERGGNMFSCAICFTVGSNLDIHGFQAWPIRSNRSDSCRICLRPRKWVLQVPSKRSAAGTSLCISANIT